MSHEHLDRIKEINREQLAELKAIQKILNPTKVQYVFRFAFETDTIPVTKDEMLWVCGANAHNGGPLFQIETSTHDCYPWLREGRTIYHEVRFVNPAQKEKVFEWLKQKPQ